MNTTCKFFIYIQWKWSLLLLFSCLCTNIGLRLLCVSDDGKLSFDEFNAYFADGILTTEELQELFYSIDGRQNKWVLLLFYICSDFDPCKMIFPTRVILHRFTAGPFTVKKEAGAVNVHLSSHQLQTLSSKTTPPKLQSKKSAWG